MRIVPTVGFALGLVVVSRGPLWGQTGSTLKPKACLAAEELFASRVPVPKTPVRALNLPGQGLSLLTIDPIRVEQKGVSVRDLVGAVQAEGALPIAGPHLVFQLHVVDSLERPIEQRQLGLELDDGPPIELGSMRVVLLSQAGAKKVEQNLTSDLTPQQFRSLVASTTGRVHLGDTEFSLSGAQLDGLRSLYTVAVCGKS
jgi:hypothetical protein